MKIDTSAVLKKIDGEDLANFDLASFARNLVAAGINGDLVQRVFAETRKALTFQSAATEALMGSYDDEKGLSGDEKLKRFRLAQKLYGGDGLPVELGHDERELIRRCVNKSYGALVYGQICEMTEGSD